MVRTVARRAKTRKQRAIERKQRREQQGRLQVALDAAIARVVREVIEEALAGEVTGLLGRGKGERRDVMDRTEVGAACNRCGRRHRHRFDRAGSYERGLLSLETWGRIAVPRVRCVCGGMVDVEFAALAPYGRQWFDLAERARQLAGLCVSLRDGVEILAWRNGQPLSIATLNKLVNQTAELATAFHAGPLARIPPVVLLDGLWVKLVEPTGEWYTDTQGRRRQRQKRRTFPVLVAYGADPATGERWVLDWEKGRDEDEPSWRVLLERLLSRGVCAANGLRLFVHDGAAGLEKAFEFVYFGPGVERQRCVFHKLVNVRRDIAGDEGMSREQRRQRRAEVLADATAVYQGHDEAEIRRRLAAFRATWVQTEPKAVATLERDFDRTLVYLRVQQRAQSLGQDWPTRFLRTTSALERVQRHFRQKARQVGLFHAEAGVDAAIQLVISRRQLAGRTQQPWTRLLEEALLAA